MRLHRGVRQERNLVVDFNFRRRACKSGLDVALFSRNRAGLRGGIRKRLLMSALVSFAFGPSSHCTSSARRPCIAVQVLSAITATPFEIWITSFTPGIAFAFAASKLATFPPNTGQRATTA